MNSSERNIGAITVAGRGIRNISLVNILKRSASIWNAPLRPISVGPIRLWAKANNLRSRRTTNKVNKTTNRDESNTISWINSNNSTLTKVLICTLKAAA